MKITQDATKQRKLTLTRETLRELTSVELKMVAGGTTRGAVPYAGKREAVARFC